MWGPPPPQPRRTNTTVLVLSIVLGVAAGAIGLIYLAYGGSDESAQPFPAAEYRLTVPQTLLDGEYELINDSSADANADAKRSGYGAGPDARNVTAVVGSYNGTSTTGNSGAVLTGMYGEFRDPAQPRDSLLRGMRKADGMSQPKPAVSITPSGSDLELKCAVLLSKDTDGTSTVPVCAWGDENTAAYVAFLTPASTAQDPDAVDLEAVAERTLKVREESRQPIGE